MMRRVLFALALLSASSWPVWSEAGHAGDVDAGRKLAQKQCASCHVVARDQKEGPFLKPPALSFEEIAQQPKANETYLEGFLCSTHNSVSRPGAMPSPQLTVEQVRDVAAYILSLREKGK